MIDSLHSSLVPHGPAHSLLPVEGRRPVSVFANAAILAGMDEKCFRQAVNGANVPGVDRLVVNADAHAGYGVPVGCVVVTDEVVMPGPVGPDIKCSMSYLQTDTPDAALVDKSVRRALIEAICARIPTGMGGRHAAKGRVFEPALLRRMATEGASAAVLADMGLPVHWAGACEDATHSFVGSSALTERMETLFSANPRLESKLSQVGSYGGGNHFGEAQAVEIAPGAESIAEYFGVKAGRVGFLSHCGSRGFGYQLAGAHFRSLKAHFERGGIPFPGGDHELVYARLGTPEADAYLADMALGANFATVNHLLINTLVLEAFQEVIPGTQGELVYYIAHNIARQELVDGRRAWVYRKGATRAFPAGHPDLRDTRFAATGHPILLPGNPEAGSYIMVAEAGAKESCYSINHGAGRAMGRMAAKRTLKQADVDASMLAHDVLSNCRNYPVDEAAAAYKNFTDVIDSVIEAKLARPVARLRARFVIKDANQEAEGAA